MSWVESMLNADGALARGVTAPTQGTLRVVKVNGVPDEIEGEDEALARLRSFGGAGWACYVSRVGTNGARIDVADGSQLPDGKVLWAELVNGAESLHLRYVGPRWHATHFERCRLARKVRRTGSSPTPWPAKAAASCATRWRGEWRTTRGGPGRRVWQAWTRRVATPTTRTGRRMVIRVGQKEVHDGIGPHSGAVQLRAGTPAGRLVRQA